MKLRSRTRHLVYETIESLPQPAELPPVETLSYYLDEYVRETGTTTRQARWWFRLSGLNRLIERLRRDQEYLDTTLKDTPARFTIGQAITMNATGVLKDDVGTSDPLDRAVRLVGAARSFYADLLSGQIEVDRFRDAPLEMGQYRNLFSTCLYPRGACFQIYKSPLDAYIVVVVSGWYFKVDLPLVDGQVDLAALRFKLAEVVTAAQDLPAAQSPGILSAATPLPRAAGLTALRGYAPGRESLETLANAFFVVCLDLDSAPVNEEEACRAAQCGNLANRWHLASQQIVVFGNAKAAVVFSYVAGIDGNVMTRFCSEVVQRAARFPQVPPVSGPNGHVPQPLRWKVPGWAVRWAAASVRPVLADDQGLYRFSDWGGTRLVEAGFRLDAIFNVALMMAARSLVMRPIHYFELLTLAKYRNSGLGSAFPWSPAVERLVDPALDLHSDAAVTALQAAFAAHAEAIRQGRRQLSLMDLLSLQLALAPVWQKPWILIAVIRLITRIDVIVSSPRNSDEIAIIGRLGITLPVRLFSVHYEIHDETISLAFMPGAARPFTNAQIAAAFKDALDTIVAVAAHSSVTEPDKSAVC
jgi:hypothetical protein